MFKTLPSNARGAGLILFTLSGSPNPASKSRGSQTCIIPEALSSVPALGYSITESEGLGDSSRTRPGPCSSCLASFFPPLWPLLSGLHSRPSLQTFTPDLHSVAFTLAFTLGLHSVAFTLDLNSVDFTLAFTLWPSLCELHSGPSLCGLHSGPSLCGHHSGPSLCGLHSGLHSGPSLCGLHSGP